MLLNNYGKWNEFEQQIEYYRFRYPCPCRGTHQQKKFVDWSKVDKEDYLLAMERSPIKDMEIKVLLKGALSNEIDSRKVYANGIDQSCYYEGYTTFKAEKL